jgi:hypothetical protein
MPRTQYNTLLIGGPKDGAKLNTHHANPITFWQIGKYDRWNAMYNNTPSPERHTYIALLPGIYYHSSMTPEQAVAQLIRRYRSYNKNA